MGESGLLRLNEDPLDELVASLASQRAAFESRPAVRALYREWHQMILGRLAGGPQPTIELGCGFGAFRDTCAHAVFTDIAPTPWADEVVDAESLPMADGSVANLVMTDVLHHLAHPLRFFEEAARVLRPGGRLVMLEPYCSLVSSPAYTHLHREGADMRVDPFASHAQTGNHPLEANNALPTLFFWRHLSRFQERFPILEVVERTRFALLAYPLSGGLEGRRLAPDGVIHLLARLEPKSSSLGRAFGFRCLVVLERGL